MATKAGLMTIAETGDVVTATVILATVRDDADATEIGDRLIALVKEKGVKKLIVDLRKVTGWTSAATGKFITLRREAATAGAKLVLFGVHENIMDIFRTTKLERLFTFVKADQDPLAAF